jgi:hypothetical protein
VAVEREDRQALVARLGQVLEPRRLQLLECRVGEVGELVVVAREDDCVAGEVGGLAVVVQVIEVGEQNRGTARVDRLASARPARLGVPAERVRRGGSAEWRPAACPCGAKRHGRTCRHKNQPATNPVTEPPGETSNSASPCSMHWIDSPLGYNPDVTRSMRA